MPNATTTVITIANHKGGVGKTTTAITLGHGLSRNGKQVLLIDLDPQGQSATSLGLDPEPCVFRFLVNPDHGTSRALTTARQLVRNTGRENFWIIPGNHTTGTAQIVLNAENRPVSYIRDAIDIFMHNGGKLDYIIFDTAPSVGGIQERAIWACDYLIVPCTTEYLGLDGARQLVESLSKLPNLQGWRGSLLGILPTMYDTTNESKVSLDDLERTFKDKLMTPIHRATILRTASSVGQTIFEQDELSRAAAEYQNLVEIVQKLK